LRVFRIENRILKKSPYQKRSRRSQKNKIFNFHNGNNSHNSDSDNISLGPHFDSEQNAFNNLNYPGCESSNNLNLQLSQPNPYNVLNIPGIFTSTKEKNFKEKSIILDATMNLTSIPIQNNTPSGNICNSPVFNIGTMKNLSRNNSYPASNNPSNNNLTSITDFNLNKSTSINSGRGVNPSGNSLGINLSNKSNFVCASNYAFGNAVGNSNDSAGNNPNNSANSQNANSNDINSFLNNFFGNGNINSTTAYSNYLNSYPEIYKSTEEFMENFCSLVNMLKSCINEIMNNEYTIKSLTNIIKNMANNGNMNANNNGNVGNQNYGNFENVEVTQVNYLNQEVFNNKKLNK